MSSLFHMLLWFVVSCSCVCRTFTPAANNGSPLAGQSWLAAVFKLMNCLFAITTITTHEENVLFCVTRIRVWLICRSSEILFLLVSKWIKICELKLCLFCLSVNLRVGVHMPNAVKGLCLCWSFLTFEHLELSTSLHSVTHTQVTKSSSGIQKMRPQHRIRVSWSSGSDFDAHQHLEVMVAGCSSFL